MQIQYYGLSCFKITVRPMGRGAEELSLYFDPISGEKGIRSVYGQANALFFSHTGEHDTASFKGSPIIFDIPGEYAFRGVNVIAVSGAPGDGETIFVVEAEEIRLAHFGSIRRMPGEKQMEAIGDIDIAFVPVGGGDETLSAKQAEELVRKLEPKIVIPMMYALPTLSKKLDTLKTFIDEFGGKKAEKMEKLVLKVKDIENRSMDIVELDPLR